jgi:RTX calcium-binding nonapeptide repeat (4 copies)
VSPAWVSPFREKARALRLTPVPALLVLTALAGMAPPSVHAVGVVDHPAEGDDILVNAPGVGEEMQLTIPGGGVEPTSTCITQSEISMARSGSTLVAGWNDGGQCEKLFRRSAGQPVDRISLSGFGYSRDGGRSWTDGGVLEPARGTHLFGDPVLAAGPDGSFYYATLVREQNLQVGVARSTDGGQSWSTPVVVSPQRDPNAPVDHDKPWLAVDTTSLRYRGSVYIAWTELTSFDVWSVLLSRSTDGGKTFSAPVELSGPPVEGAPTHYNGGLGTQVAVGPQGEVYVAWVGNGAAPYVWITRSLDGGVTFSPPRPVALLFKTGHPSRCVPQAITNVGGTRQVIKGDIRVFEWLSMAVDVSGSSDPGSPRFNPYRGTVYLAAPHDDDGNPEGDTDAAPVPEQADESDVVFFRSRDGGVTWSNVDDPHPFDPALDLFPDDVLNDDGTETDQFHPQVSVDSEGRVAVAWYDRRVSAGSVPNNWEMALFATVSEDGGETFGTQFQVSDEIFPPSRTNPNTNWMSGCYMGEYNAVLGGDEEFLLAWGDNRDGTEAHPDPNVYFDRITFPHEVVSPPGEGPSPPGEDSPQPEPGGGGDSPGGGGGGAPGGGDKPSGGDAGPAPRCLPEVHIVGTHRRDTLIGTPQPDVICGLGRADSIRGLGGDDIILGGRGRDRLGGGRGHDVCRGGPGRDRLRRCEARRARS